MTAPSTAHLRSIPYQPPLDGLRGAAVAAVLLFHSGFDWMRGGYLGVSAFFTLSGFLIASILDSEVEQNGRISLQRFWARRARRLLPAAWLCLGGIVIYGYTAATASQARALPGDVLASLAYVANWRLLFSGGSYEALFASPSPITHLWSLAIEEQFYLVFPLLTVVVVALVQRRGRGDARRRRTVAATYAAVAIASSIAMAVLHDPSGDTARVYYGTDTRAAELLIGASAGLAFRAWSRRGAHAEAAPRLPSWVLGAGVVALAACVAAWSQVGQAEPALYRGGFSLHALAVVAVIVAAHHPGPVRTVLSFEPLRLLGLISYGVYLYHWPLYLVLDEARTGLDGPWLLAVRVSMTLVVSIASYHLVELPVRDRRRILGHARVVAAPAVVVLLAAPVVLATPEGDGGPEALPPPPAPVTVPATSAPTTVTAQDDEEPAAQAPVRVAVFGDSTALMLSLGLAAWTDDSDLSQYAGGVTELGCGLTRHGEVDYHGNRGRIEDHCNDWAVEWPSVARDQQVDVAVVLVGPWDVADRRLEGDQEWRAPGDPVYDQYLRSEIRTALEVLAAETDTVVWLTSPRIELGRLEVPPPAEPYPASDPERMERFNEILREEVAAFEGNAVIADYARFLESLPGGVMDESFRPDGVHLTEESSRRVADWLGPLILETR